MILVMRTGFMMRNSTSETIPVIARHGTRDGDITGRIPVTAAGVWAFHTVLATLIIITGTMTGHGIIPGIILMHGIILMPGVADTTVIPLTMDGAVRRFTVPITLLLIIIAILPVYHLPECGQQEVRVP